MLVPLYHQRACVHTVDTIQTENEHASLSYLVYVDSYKALKDSHTAIKVSDIFNFSQNIDLFSKLRMCSSLSTCSSTEATKSDLSTLSMVVATACFSVLFRHLVPAFCVFSYCHYTV